MVSTPYLLLCRLTHKNSVPSGNLLPGWCLLAGRRLGRSHPSNGNISPLATYLLFLGFSILLQTHGSGPFVAGLGQAKDGRRERRSCCGKIFALPFSGIWTKSWDNRIQDFLSSLSFFFFFLLLRVFASHIVLLYFMLCAASCLHFGQGCYEISCGSVLFSFSK